MKVGVGYCDNPDSSVAGLNAARQALANAERSDACDMVLLFATATHNAEQLREAVLSVFGDVPVYGGGSVGIITNKEYGYAGNQVGLACFWLDKAECDVFLVDELDKGEAAAGRRLGEQLKNHGVTPDSSVMMFYDAIEQTEQGVRILMATWLLEGIKDGLGFLPALTGAGIQGDHICTPTAEFVGDAIGQHQVMALSFSDNITIDSTIMHGCRPASTYYTVTRAEGPVILEINGEPAIPFIDNVLGSAITPDQYPFFLLFGINHGEAWGEYDENNYASRLCLGLDPERNGIVMFEPDMVAGTRFQLMFRSMDLDYMRPKIESLFEQLGDREPVLAMYIDCAGRCAGYGGIDMEDAVVLQEMVGDRVPVLGLYTGVEIAPIGGRSRGLDWTGVFCLFSQARDGQKAGGHRQTSNDWESTQFSADADEVSTDALIRLCEQNAAKVLDLDTKSIAIRQELEQKRRGFRLLAELSALLGQTGTKDNLFKQVAKRINATLNMQKTAVLMPKEDGSYSVIVLQGYSTAEKVAIMSHPVLLDPELLESRAAVVVTAADPDSHLRKTRNALNLPYFVAAPVVVKNQTVAVLITGRMAEQIPFLSRLGLSDAETVQAISALLASVITHQRFEAAEERNRLMVEAMPLSCLFWNENGNLIDSNAEAVRLFGCKDKEELIANFVQMSPQVQPDGLNSSVYSREYVLDTFIKGEKSFDWTHIDKYGEVIPVRVNLVRVPMGEDYCVVGYMSDQREQQAAMAELQKARDMAEDNVRMKNEFLASVSHEIRTPMNAILAMAGAVSELNVSDEVRQLVENGVHSVRLLNAEIDSILDFSRIESGDVELKAEPFAIRNVVQHVEDLLAERVNHKGLALSVTFRDDVPETVIGDSVRVEQIIYNLVSNAVKFTEAGSVNVEVRAREILDEGRTILMITVSDTGSGIDESKQKDLFKPLTQLETAYDKRQSGVGMGLAISRGLAILMDGDIMYRNADGGGSIFTALLTLKQKAEHELADGRDCDDPYQELQGMQVLVVEDNPINQLIMEALLKKVGVEVTKAEHGVEALKILESRTFDLVFMDIQMPEMDGLTATAKIRENPVYDQMPILAMTAHSSKEHREESRKSGMDDHLTKPIEVKEVCDALLYWRRNPRAERSRR